MQLAYGQIPNHWPGSAEYSTHDFAGADKIKALGMEEVFVWCQAEGSAKSVMARKVCAEVTAGLVQQVRSIVSGDAEIGVEACIGHNDRLHSMATEATNELYRFSKRWWPC